VAEDLLQKPFVPVVCFVLFFTHSDPPQGGHVVAVYSWSRRGGSV
jgi:hypothetical protein